MSHPFCEMCNFFLVWNLVIDVFIWIRIQIKIIRYMQMLYISTGDDEIFSLAFRWSFCCENNSVWRLLYKVTIILLWWAISLNMQTQVHIRVHIWKCFWGEESLSYLKNRRKVSSDLLSLSLSARCPWNFLGSRWYFFGYLYAISSDSFSKV